MVIAVHELKTIPGSAKLVRSTIIYYALTTLGAACIGMFIAYTVLVQKVKKADLDDDGDDDDCDDLCGNQTARCLQGVIGRVPEHAVEVLA